MTEDEQSKQEAVTKENAERKAAPELAIKPPIALNIQKEPGSDERVQIGLREMDEATYKMLRMYFNKDQVYEAVAAWIQTCYIGGDPINEVVGNFRRQQACIPLLIEYMQPLEAELKKN